MLFKIWRFTYLKIYISRDFLSVLPTENSRFLESISQFLPSAVDKISRFFVKILSLNLLIIQFTFHRVSFLFIFYRPYSFIITNKNTIELKSFTSSTNPKDYRAASVWHQFPIEHFFHQKLLRGFF
jgi:hypothetical protein